ncbi:MAG: V-type ATP synthase subunit F [Caldimonas sp.]
MTLAVYLGDEVAAAGWRLAGARVRLPARADAAKALAEACADAELVLLSSRLAASIGEGALRGVLAAPAPLVLVVPDLDGDVAIPDPAARLRAQLGLEA